MSNVGEVKNQMQEQKGSELPTIEQMIKKSVKTLGEALPKHMNAERLVRIALTTMRLNPELYKCTPESFMGALFQSAQLGLEPNVEGQAYIIPFNNKRKIGNDWKTIKEAQFQIGYKGYVELFYRHNSAVSLDFQKVQQNDAFDFNYGTDAYIKHSPALTDRGEVIAYYAVAKMAHGAVVFRVMSRQECLDHAITHSKCYDKQKGEFYKNTPWRSHFDSMALKTVLMGLMKLLPKSVELQKAVSFDETIKTRVAPDMSQIGDQTNWDDPEGSGVAEGEIVPPEGHSAAGNGIPEGDQTPENDPPEPKTELKCYACGCDIDEKVKAFSTKKWGKPLCRKCQEFQEK